eukprot:CAMPEP_0198264836 /NCGR_PEP_ID=MMETSP1447-20131203/17946_1 /TAXON_ID=420782 /ORGANISM="Chaetoceros dichaeta, Strain CCMP1751" /LENGTH=94 /DNA_ID=CAMNT_0043953951 /DNA_START=64 /DNA_END=348 /DNA_ORIENTATION=+
MYINSTTIILTILLIATIGYIALQLLRHFAFSIAVENHEANKILDDSEERLRSKRIMDADSAAQAAFAKVEPLLPVHHIAASAQQPVHSPNKKG